jgi:diguanylate cyclase (GGDEF)-like protein
VNPHGGVNGGVPPVAHAPRRGLLRLRFPEELEAEFRAAHRDTHRRWARMSLLLALSTTLGFALIDHWVLPNPSIGHSDLVRFGLHLPMVLVMIVLTLDRYFDRWYQLGIQVTTPLFGIGTVILATQATGEQVPLIAARLVLVIFFMYFMVALPFHAALRTNLIIVAGYVVAFAAGSIEANVATYQLFVLFCANLIGGAGCYALEHANRIAFLDRRRLAEVAMHDGLTGLLNRHALEEQARRLWQQASRDRLAVSVVLIDIDHFKAFNDRYGHQAGDQCLRDVAAAVRRASRRRPLDLVARYGGEEIIAVLFGADRTHAENVTRNVLDAVRDLRIPHVGSTTRPYVTVSVGAATVEPGADYTHEFAVQLADRALYAAKGRGRDNGSYLDSNLTTIEPPASDDLLKTAS